MVSIGHYITTRLSHIAHYGKIRDSVSSCYRFGNTNAYVIALDVGNTIFVFVGQAIE